MIEILAFVVALLASGCVVWPAHAPPPVAVPAAWSATGADAAAVPDTTALARWWTSLRDTTLTRLVERGLRANLDVRQAEARVLEARGRRGSAVAMRFPVLTGGASSQRSTSSGSTTETPARGSSSRTLYSAGADAGWELDLFGAQRRGLESANASLQVNVETLRDVLVTLSADVALEYVGARVAQERLARAEANLRLQAETYEIVRYRREAGLVTELDVEQARLNLEQTRASIPALRTSLAASTNGLALLLGEPSSAIERALAEPCGIPSAPVTIAVGLPADVLRRRPDVRRAERQLAAQAAQVGVAGAQRFPALRLAGSIGLEALTVQKLLSSAARALLGSVATSGTLFDAGQLRSNVALQRALRQEYAAAYEATVLAALREVQDALVAYAEEQARHEALSNAAEAARRAAALAEQRYRAGLVDFPVVLDAQRSLLAVEDALAVSTGTVTSNLVRLYRAAGGGWTPDGALRTR